jgi:hypothetical protein
MKLIILLSRADFLNSAEFNSMRIALIDLSRGNEKTRKPNYFSNAGTSSLRKEMDVLGRMNKDEFPVSCRSRIKNRFDFTGRLLKPPYIGSFLLWFFACFFTAGNTSG